jgi:ADP-ribosylglycohydrolase
MVPNPVTLHDAIAGGMWGLLIGDAAGVPYEFTTGLDADDIEMPPPGTFDRSHRDAPAGAWSDDGAQALCLLASLLDCDRLDVADFAERLLRWRDKGYLAVDGVVFDVGGQTSVALSALRRGVAPAAAGPAGEMDNGNGSLMRVLPLALWHCGSDADLMRDAAQQSLPTHGHVRSQVCCALYCLWIRRTLEYSTEPWHEATRTLRALAVNQPDWLGELDTHLRPDQPASGNGSGYVVDCLHSARLASQQPTFERVIRTAIAFGNDTDTTAAVAGGFAGVRDGLSAIPDRWRRALARVDLAAPLIERLIEHRRARARFGT